METKDKQFEEQDHPLKNTDHAFVKVGKSGEPIFPKDEAKEEDHPAKDGTTTIDHR